MKINQITFKNFCSYGNKIQQIDIPKNPQLILIKGKNGKGKSSIRNAFNFAIYGSCAIKKNKSLANRLNKNCYTDIKLDTDDQQQLEIERGLEPNFNQLYINNKAQEKDSSKNVFDDKIEKLVGIPFNIFTNTISISVDQFKSFISLKAEEKRKIIDKVFNLDKYNEINTKVKETLSSKKNESESLQNTINNNSSILENSYHQLEKLKNEINEQVDNEISEKKQKIQELDPSINQIEEEITNFQNNIKQDREKLQKAKDKKSELNSTINTNNKQLKLLEGDQCPYCYSDLNDEKHQQIKQDLVNENKQSEDKIKKLDSKINEFDQQIKTNDSKLHKLTDKKSKLKSDKSTLENEIKKLEDKKNNDSQLNKLKETISDVETKQQQIQDQKDKLDDEIAKLKELSKILTDEKGVKGTVMDKIVPTLNERIKYYSYHFDSEFDVEFDKYFNASIKIFNQEIDTESLSTGELKKINLISALAILETLMMQHNLNVLFLDELFSSLDPDNVGNIVSILKELVEKYQLVIFTISHMSPPTEEFNQIYEVYKDESGFSDIQNII